MTKRKNNTTKLRSYRIKDYTEEAECESCGYPFMVGDRALETVDQQHVYCSQACCESAEFLRRAA